MHQSFLVCWGLDNARASENALLVLANLTRTRALGAYLSCLAVGQRGLLLLPPRRVRVPPIPLRAAQGVGAPRPPRRLHAARGVRLAVQPRRRAPRRRRRHCRRLAGDRALPRLPRLPMCVAACKHCNQMKKGLSL